jgi:hypothetical protein
VRGGSATHENHAHHSDNRAAGHRRLERTPPYRDSSHRPMTTGAPDVGSEHHHQPAAPTARPFTMIRRAADPDRDLPRRRGLARHFGGDGWRRGGLDHPIASAALSDPKPLPSFRGKELPNCRRQDRRFICTGRCRDAGHGSNVGHSDALRSGFEVPVSSLGIPANRSVPQTEGHPHQSLTILVSARALRLPAARTPDENRSIVHHESSCRLAVDRGRQPNRPTTVTRPYVGVRAGTSANLAESHE